MPLSKGKQGARRFHRTCVGIFLFALGLASNPLQGLDPARSIHQYGHDHWNQQNGFPGNAVNGIYQLQDGYLWIHSGGNLFRFDGIRFTQVLPEVNGHPTGEAIRATGLALDGRLLVRSLTRTLKYDRGTFTETLRPIQLPDGKDMSIREVRDGSIWIGSDNHIYRIKDGQLDLIAKGVGHLRFIVEDRQGRVWLGGSRTLFCYEDNRMKVYSGLFTKAATHLYIPYQVVADPGGLQLKVSPTALLEDEHGILWVATMEGLYKMKDGRLFQDGDTLPFKDIPITSMLEDREKNLWIGTTGRGLFRLTKGRCSNLRASDGLSDDDVLSLQEDQEGSFWIGTRVGLDRLRNTPLITFTTKDGLSNDNTCSILEGLDGGIYIYTGGGGITLLKDGRSTVFNIKNGLGDNFAGNLFLSRNGGIWAGTGRGLTRIRNGRAQTFTAGGRLLHNYISSICEDDEGLILACTDLNLYRFRDDHLDPYELRLAPGTGTESIRYVYMMFRDEEGTLWFGMTAGLYRLGRHEPPDKAVRTAFRELVRSIYDDGRGFIWITSRDTSGFTRLNKKDGTLVRYTEEAGARVDQIGKIISDAHGNLWMNTRNGIVTFSREELDAYALDNRTKLHPRVFGSLDGLKTEECGTGIQPAAWRGKVGRMFFTSQKGLAVIDPEHMTRNTLIPPIHIEELVADRVVHAPGPSLVLPPGKEYLEIHYSAASLLVPSRVRFRYQLQGYDPDWVDAGTRRTAYYTHLPPGTYHFKVIACNNDGLWNENGATFTFILRPHFYQTPWFYLFCIAALAGAGYAMHLLRTHQMRLRQTKLRAMVNERTQELQEEIAERSRAEEMLGKYQAHLEQVVAERTSELQNTNQQLQREVVERRQGEEALRQSEDRYRRFFEEDVAGAFIAKPDGQILTCNPAFARMLGLSDPSVATSYDLMWLFRDREAVELLLDRICQEGRVLDCEFEMERTNGRPLSILANLIGQFDKECRLTEIKGYVLDTTQRKDLEEQLRHSQKMEAIGQLAGGVSHDFNNLLTVIQGCSEILVDEPTASVEVKSLASEILGASDRAATLTRQLLAFSRRQVLQPQELDLNVVILPMETMLRRLIGEHINLVMSLEPHLGWVKADPVQIEQVVLNLVINARDAMPNGGNLTIETTNVTLDEAFAQRKVGLHAGEYTRLTVRDDGSGMNSEVQAHVFEPFFTTKGLGKGTGLGLSTVYGIIEQSSGHLSFDTEPGRGSAFHIHLPRIHPATKDEAPLSTPAKDSRGCETILLVEDNEQVRSMARLCLQKRGYSVIEAGSGEEALQRFQEETSEIHLLLTDVVMPGMNGKELADQILAHRPSMKILFMSGYTDEVLVRFGGSLENIALLDKPFTPTTLLQRVREMIDEHG